MRSSIRKLLAFLVVIAVLVVAVSVFSVEFPSYRFGLRYVYAAIAFGGGVLLSRELSIVVVKELKPRMHDAALTVGNAISVAGYVASALVAASYASLSPTGLLATAAASGLVLGLALQPTLGSFFAGILILVSGEIRPGSQVRILTWHVPFQWAFSPGYKYFSPDQVYAGYMAEVIEIGVFFTTVLTEEGQTMKFPNTILATDAAIVTYTERDYIFNVRYEFSNRFDPGLVLRRVEEETRDFPVLHVYVNEQSDKEYYIVKVVLNAREKDHAALKSEILTRFIRLQRGLAEGEEKSEARSGPGGV
jgi:small-conductance mechanosensitive channel